MTFIQCPVTKCIHNVYRTPEKKLLPDTHVCNQPFVIMDDWDGAPPICKTFTDRDPPKTDPELLKIITGGKRT